MPVLNVGVRHSSNRGEPAVAPVTPRPNTIDACKEPRTNTSHTHAPPSKEKLPQSKVSSSVVTKRASPPAATSASQDLARPPGITTTGDRSSAPTDVRLPSRSKTSQGTPAKTAPSAHPPQTPVPSPPSRGDAAAPQDRLMVLTDTPRRNRLLEELPHKVSPRPSKRKLYETVALPEDIVGPARSPEDTPKFTLPPAHNVVAAFQKRSLELGHLSQSSVPATSSDIKETAGSPLSPPGPRRSQEPEASQGADMDIIQLASTIRELRRNLEVLSLSVLQLSENAGDKVAVRKELVPLSDLVGTGKQPRGAVALDLAAPQSPPSLPILVARTNSARCMQPLLQRTIAEQPKLPQTISASDRGATSASAGRFVVLPVTKERGALAVIISILTGKVENFDSFQVPMQLLRTSATRWHVDSLRLFALAQAC
ncbi:hypothetical protein BC834DRAFT_840953 [Gloeopeniophorella convolvens]|nr:hypothetical protein BC834DRAFT_840953 [Gloeopeniophorella convolvens]